MKVGVVTFHAAHNYGAMLQSYALCTTLQESGYDVRLVHYWSSRKQKALYPLVLSKSLRVMLYGFYSLFPGNSRKRLQRFRTFLLSHQILSERRYFTYQELESDPPPYDAFICGSDQIWNPTYDMDPAYFLRFVPKHSVKKIAYAASIGEESIPQEKSKRLRQWIMDIPCVSIREKQGQRLIMGITGQEVPVVLDPTLLRSAEQWMQIAQTLNNLRSPYVLVYGMVKDSLLLELVQYLKVKMGLRIVSIQSNPLIANWVINADLVVRDAGPREFLSLFENASFVCTNSFHGTAFSIIFRKNFVVSRRKSTYSRITGLLELLELTSQEVAAIDEIPSVPLKIDYSLVTPLLQKEIAKSLYFLETALS